MANMKYEPVSEGHYFNRCISVDEETQEKKFETYSLWGLAKDCEFDDGTNAQDLNDRLVANDTKFVFDYKNGKYGYNTDPNRGADTFVPFWSQPY